eukprot:CAMPEP_0197414788 /NCGR_PEP_ID=MMETSP1170-20131217/1479_1 /TAXON_ID=54406 /ORGANISM="Sarcinochrysis sp, Strain CCMP770" /LENGTH=89 /DNA_ID=CAMNT_0042941539 /DNA_START=146 /DNA_END=411 /DNA_ORIENTATION=-
MAATSSQRCRTEDPLQGQVRPAVVLPHRAQDFPRLEVAVVGEDFLSGRQIDVVVRQLVFEPLLVHDLVHLLLPHDLQEVRVAHRRARPA